MMAHTALAVYVVPRAKRTEFAGHYGDAVRVRLSAPPVDGAANDELVRFLAERLGVPRRAITIRSGASSRRKTVAITGLTREAITARLAAALSAAVSADR